MLRSTISTLLFLAIGVTASASAQQARSLAGFAYRTLIFCLPGSTGACKLAWDGILAHQLDHRHKPCNFVSHLK